VQSQGAEPGCRDWVQSLLKEGKHKSAPMLGFVNYLHFYRDPSCSY
jgi:hypothetical protein